MKKIIMVSLLPLSFLLAGNFNIGSFDILNGGYNQNTDIEEEHQSSAIDTMRSTGGEPYSMSSPTSMSTVDGGDVSSGGGSAVVSTGASGIEFYSTGDVTLHYWHQGAGKRTKLQIRPSSSKLNIVVENQNKDVPTKSIEFVSSSNAFVGEYTGGDPKVYYDLPDNGRVSYPTYWYQKVYIENGILKIQAGYKPQINCKYPKLRNRASTKSDCDLGSLQTVTTWLQIDAKNRTVTSSGKKSSPNRKLHQGITVDTASKQICFSTNLYSIYSTAEDGRGFIDKYFNKNDVTNCMKYLFR